MEAELTRTAVRLHRKVTGPPHDAIELGKARHLLPASTDEGAVDEVDAHHNSSAPI